MCKKKNQPANKEAKDFRSKLKKVQSCNIENPKSPAWDTGFQSGLTQC